MQSLKFSNFSSLGARRTKHGLGRRSTWAMGVLAVLLAALALAVPMQQSASAQTPEPNGTVTITVDTDSIDYETATATITVTGGDTLFDRADVDHTVNWYVSVKHTIKESGDYSEAQQGGPGAYDPDFEFGEPDADGVFTVTVKLDKWTDGNSDDQVLINSLVPGSTYVVEAVLAFDNPNYRTADRATDEFNTKGVCALYTGAKDKREWHSRSGLRIDDNKITRTSMVVAVNVPWDIAPLNSGICLYYTMTGGGSTVKGSAFVYNQGSGARIGWIIATGLKPGTHYDFTIGIDPDLSGFNSGIGARTDGPRLTVSVGDVEQTSATVTVTLPEGGVGEELVHLAYYKAEYQYEPDLDDKKVTPPAQTTANRSTSFDLETLTPGTAYWVDVSMIAGFPTYETKSEPFTTKPGKPTELEVAPGDRQLEVSWQAPDGGDAIDEYIVQWKSGSGTFTNAETDNREQTVAHVPGTTTYETIVSSLDNGTLYTVQVIAKNESDQAISDTATGTPDALPNKPTIQSVVEGHTQLVVTWDEPANTGSDITGYVVQWKDNSVSGWESPLGSSTLEETDFTHTITSLANGTEYAVRVRAVNGLVLPDEDEDDYNWSDDETGTPRPDPIVTGVTVADSTITRTSATATVAIDNQTDDGQTVHLQYRKTTESGWTPVPPKDVTATATSETFDLSSLTGNTSYVVEAWLATTSSTKASVEFTTDPVEPDAPRNVEITGFGDGELTVAWDAPLGNGGSTITGYKVQWKEETTPNWDSPSEESDDASPYIIENLTNGTRYDVRVLAVNDVGDGPPSGDVEGTPSTRPKPPTITDITHGHQKLTVTWTAPTGADTGGSDITGYIVQWKKGTDPYNTTNQATPPASPYEITNLKNGTLYTVRVFAVNKSYPDDPSDESNEMTGTPSTVPQPPTDVTITGFGDESLTVSWTAPTDTDTGGSPITGFKIQWKLNSEADWNTNTYTEVDDDDGQSPYTIEGVLTNGTKYDVRVIAVNINGDSRESDSATGMPSRKPNAPTGVDITDYGDGWLEVTWNAVTGTDTGGSDIKNYIVQWKSGTNYDTTNQATPPPTKTTYKITNLKNGTEYTVRLLAVNETYPNDPSVDPRDGTNVDSGTPKTKPKPPTGVNISEYGDGFLKVGWTAPEDNGGSDLTEFKVQWKESSVSGWDSPSEETVNAVSGQTDYETTISSLTNGTEYTVRVLAVNGNRPTDNTSDTSNTASGTPSTMPRAPNSVTITNKGDRTLTVTWEPPDNDGGSAITKYKVQWKGDGETQWTPPANEKLASDRSHEIIDLTNGTEYTVQVFARNEHGLSTEYGEVTGIPSKKPDPPTDVEVSAHGNKWLEVTWTEPIDKGGLDTTYIVQWKWGANDFSETYQETSAISPQEISNLQNGTLYAVRVLAENARGKSGTSNTDTGTPMTKPQPPTDVSIAGFGDKSLTVSWTAPTGIEGTGGSPITGFKIQWKLNSEADWNTNTYTEVDDEDGQSPYTIEGVLTNGTKYDVRVLAVNGNDNLDDNTSDPSDAATGTPSKKPDAPTGVDITDYGNGWLEVTWTAVMDEFTGGSPIKNYIVQWKSGTNDYDTTNQATPAASPYTITNLMNGTEYTVRLLAVNETYPNDPSVDPRDGTNVDSGTPRTIPDEVTDLEVISGDKELTVSWTAPVPEKNGGVGVSRYIVQWRSGNQEYDTSRQETPSNTSQVIKKLTNRTPYSIQVRADNGEEPEGEQNYNWEETTGTPMTVPGAPTNLEVEEGHRQLIVSWVAPTDTGGVDIEIDHFVVQWQVKGGNWSSPDEHTTTDGETLTDTITGLLNGTDYDIRVRADNDVEGQTFQWAYTTGKPRTIPGPPTGLSVTPGDGQLTLSWVAPRENGGLTINRYIVQWKSGIQQYDTSRQATPPTNSQVIGQLTNDTPHSVRVRADNTVVLPNEDSYNWAFGNDTPAAVQNPPPYNPPQQNNPPPQRSPVNPTPPVTKSPEVSRVTFADISQTSANATVNIRNAGTAQKTVLLHYRIKDTTAWSTPPERMNTSGSSTIIPLTNLTAGTTYEAQAWLLNSNSQPSGAQIYEFNTLDEVVPDPGISNLKCENIGQTSATAMVEIANAGTGMKEVFLKHSMDGTDEWTQIPFPTITYADSTSINLTGLQEGTTYQVVVALSDDFSGMVIESCATLPLDPVVSGISVDRRKQNSVWANISIANADGEDQTVHLRYRTTTPQGEWSDIAETTTSTDSASKEISGLAAHTEYEVQASLDGSFPDDLTKNATFTTLRFPSISNLEVEDETKNSATAVITIADPDGSSQTIHLRHRTTTPQGEWSRILETSSTTAEASLGLKGLAPDTEYEAEVSLTDDFGVSETDTFRTLPLDPVVSKVSVNSIRQTTATAYIDIANANGNTQTVSLRYRTTTPRGAWSGIKTATSDTDNAEIDLTELTPGTEYDVQASLENSFPSSRTRHDTFTTLRWPSISTFEVENVGRNGATVSATIADSRGVAQTVHVSLSHKSC